MADLTPPVISTDPKLKALAALSERLSTLDLTPVLTNLVDAVEADVLPCLADQFHVMGDEGWLLANTDERRRKLIKQSIEIHRHKGTVWAVKSVLEALAVSAEVTEWWQTVPRGAPYTFDLLAWVNDNLSDTSAVLSPETYQRLRRLVDMNKPVRSHFSFRVGARFDDALGAANASQVAAVGRWPADAVAVQPPPAANPIQVAGAADSQALGRWTGVPAARQPPPAIHLLRAASAARSLTVIRISMEAR